MSGAGVGLGRLTGGVGVGNADDGGGLCGGRPLQMLVRQLEHARSLFVRRPSRTHHSRHAYVIPAPALFFRHEAAPRL